LWQKVKGQTELNIINQNNIPNREPNMNQTQIGKDRLTPCLFGFALITVGLAICFVGAQNLKWILDHGILTAPVLVLVIFAVLGAGSIAGALLQK
jgi:hypothetical protein